MDIIHNNQFLLPPKIIDCFLYNGEPIVFERLKYLYDVVDTFIITEFKETHSGTIKDEYFVDIYSKEFEPYNNKIIYLKCDKIPPIPTNWIHESQHKEWMINKEAWWKENYQRNYAYSTSTLANIKGSYVLIGCDVDEIPRKSLVETLPSLYPRLRVGAKLSMLLFYYSTKWVKPYRWTHPFVVNDIGIASKGSLEPYRTGIACELFILQAGWHCSYFMTPEEIMKKIESFAHTEYNSDEYKNKEWIYNCIQTGEDVFNRGSNEKLIIYDGDEGYPFA